MKHLKIILLTGGNNDESKVSLLSAQNVEKALQDLGYEYKTLNISFGLAHIVKDLKKSDLVFPVIHGKEGEGGSIQEDLEKLHVKFVGAKSAACKKGWDKLQFKIFCQQEGIVTPSWLIIYKGNTNISLDYPYVIKPTDNGSSVDVCLIKNEVELKNAKVDELLKKYSSLIVEEYISGIEVTAGILGNKALPLIEIQPPNGELFNYENKYNGKTKELPFAPSLTNKQQLKVQKLALLIHNKLGYQNYSRVDFIYANDIAYALEINTIPGLTEESLYPRAA